MSTWSKSLLGLGAAGLAVSGLSAAAPAFASSESDTQRRVFQLPFQCGHVWQGATYHGHYQHGSVSNHYPLDFNYGAGDADRGKWVYASAGGTAQVKSDSASGKYVRIVHKGGWATFYMHLHSVNVKSGQKIHRGHHIGSVGDTGNAQGVHLHYEQRKNNVAQPIWFDGKPLKPGYSFSYNGPSYKSKNCPR